MGGFASGLAEGAMGVGTSKLRDKKKKAPKGKPVKAEPVKVPQQPVGSTPMKPIASLKKGGKIKKTGLYRLHKGETVKRASRHKKVAKAQTMKKLMHSPPMCKIVPKHSGKRQYGKHARGK